MKTVMYSTSHGNFPALTKDNYRAWSIAMKSVLDIEDEWEYVTGEKKCPLEAADGSNQAEIQAFIKKSKKIALFIRLGVTDQIGNYIRNSYDPKAIWDILKKRLDPIPNEKEQYYIRREFNLADLFPGEAFVDYADRLVEIQYKLAETDSRITDSEIIDKIFFVFEMKYGSAVRILRKKDETDIEKVIDDIAGYERQVALRYKYRQRIHGK